MSLNYYSVLTFIGIGSFGVFLALLFFREEVICAIGGFRRGGFRKVGAVRAHERENLISLVDCSRTNLIDESCSERLSRLMLLFFAVAMSVLLIVFRQTTWHWPPLTQAWASVLLAILGALCIMLSPSIARAVIPRDQTAQSLAWIRLVVCAGLLLLATRVNLADIALLPAELIRFRTLVSPLVDAIWTPNELRDAATLSAIQFVTIVSLVCAMLGFGARPMMILAALSYTLFYHLQITYTHFYHSGLIPLQILYVLCFMPTHRSLSLDRVIARRLRPTLTSTSSSAPTLTYGWCVYLCWTIYGVSYFATGLSKFWVDPWWPSDGNVLAMSLSDSLHIIEYDFNLSGLMVNWGVANFIFPVVGLAAMVIEWSGILILIYGWARLVIPWLIASLHFGIWFCHDFLFYELALMPLMFLPLLRQALWQKQAPPSRPLATTPWMRLGGAAIVSGVCSLILSGWLYSRDSFPLLSYWGMYAVHSNRPLEWVHYSTVYKVRASGTRERTELHEYFSILNHARWLDHLGYSSDPERLKRMKALFAKVYEIEQSSIDPVVSFEIESNSWNVKDDPSDSNFGSPTHRMRFNRDDTVTEEKL